MNEDNKYDALREIFRQQLENHEVPVDSSDWDIINKRLPKRSSTRAKIIGIWSAVAALVAIVLIFTMFYTNQNQFVTKKQEKYAGVEIHHAKPDSAVSIQKKPEDKAEDKANYSSEKNSFATAKKIKTQTNQVDQPVKEPGTVEFNIKDTVISPSKEILVAETQETNTPPKEIKKNEKKDESAFYATNIQYNRKKKEKEGLLLAASFATSGGVGNNVEQHPLQYYDVAFGSISYNSPQDATHLKSEILPEDASVEYLPPLSFGLTLRKNINSRFGIETGLVYTYLSAKYQWHQNFKYDGKRQMNYLGIPLNGIVYIWNNHSKWDVYFSGGVMIEKGIGMRTIKNQYNPNSIYTTKEDSSIDGFQWSLNGSLGITYHLSRNMGLYFEPRLGYYFDNDQPKSIRTDWPLTVGIGAGLRYSF